MKGIFDLLKPKSPKEGREIAESTLFTTAFSMGKSAGKSAAPWEARAVEVVAQRVPKSRGGKLLESVWEKDQYMSHLSKDALERMQRFFAFASVPPGRDLIRQDEYGTFMVVLLTGSIGVDRRQPWGEHLRLAETRPGDILGEMSLLDSGIRFSTCTTLTDCEIAVLSADAIDEMMAQDAPLAAALIALLARKLSLRLRVVSSRLSDNPNG
ncbi:cyclic nucleotide-binding domain-containing protein [Diaphorobacter aerolatus]|uniref:Cyclic nucleotide-binding domain-containing protein n=1 Tax=Diaphorobacter aerolatus TaxID=1288495 RepID=A0A7H0GP81_9BURK|nr:cyclic nucleotide-binding domain-containing protein [Diaphorobacter aerolatus]QNP50097.1 cyclic nucleotide-binding domain-containing protein [Diaphorobacter aerolatus]